MKVGDLVNLKAVKVIGIVVKQIPSLTNVGGGKYHQPDHRFRIMGLTGRAYEVQTSSVYWEVISESG